MKNLENIKVLDCTLRDGGYINDWQFSNEFGHELYRALSEANVDYVEIGFFNQEQQGGVWSRITKEVVDELRRDESGPKIAAMVDYGKLEIDEILPSTETGVDMVRVATPKSSFREGTEFAAALSELGYETTVNYMAISHYSNQELLELASLMNVHGERVEYFYVADSFGNLLPSRTREIISTLRFATTSKIGFHPHNNLQMAFANSLEAVMAGIDILDGSITGMGRGAGNLILEALLAYLERSAPGRYDVLPVLRFAELYMNELRERYEWGYSLPQLLSGTLNCHPNYATRLLDLKHFPADDVYRILKNMQDEKKARFDSETLRIRTSEFMVARSMGTFSISKVLGDKLRQCKGKALILCGGKSIETYREAIEALYGEGACFVVAVNRPVEFKCIHAVYFANRRRLLRNMKMLRAPVDVLIGPQIDERELAILKSEGDREIFPIKLDNADLSEIGKFPINSGVEAALSLFCMGFERVEIAGMDGFGESIDNFAYDETDIVNSQANRRQLDEIAIDELAMLRRYADKRSKSFGIVTPTLYKDYYQPGVLQGEQ